jgi:hypothetical protein
MSAEAGLPHSTLLTTSLKRSSRTSAGASQRQRTHSLAFPRSLVVAQFVDDCAPFNRGHHHRGRDLGRRVRRRPTRRCLAHEASYPWRSFCGWANSSLRPLSDRQPGARLHLRLSWSGRLGAPKRWRQRRLVDGTRYRNSLSALASFDKLTHYLRRGRPVRLERSEHHLWLRPLPRRRDRRRRLDRTEPRRTDPARKNANGVPPQHQRLEKALVGWASDASMFVKLPVVLRVRVGGRGCGRGSA